MKISENIQKYEEFRKNPFFTQSPAGVYDNEQIINFALKKNALIVTNDKYREFDNREELWERSIRFSMISDVIELIF